MKTKYNKENHKNCKTSIGVRFSKSKSNGQIKRYSHFESLL